MSTEDEEAFSIEASMDTNEGWSRGNSFADALSENLSRAEESRGDGAPALALAKIPAPPDQGEARRRQQKSQQLLADEGDTERAELPDELSISFMSKIVGSWVRNAAAFITPTSNLAASGSLSQAASASVPVSASVSVSAATTTTTSSSSSTSTSTSTTTPTTTASTSIQAHPLATRPPKHEEKVVDATDSICSYPNCIQALNIAVSRFHCRKCNGWYCARHAGHPTFGLRLRVGTGQPSKEGVWSRVCELCFTDYFYPKVIEPAPCKDYTRQFLATRDAFQRESNERLKKLKDRYARLAAHQRKTKSPVPLRVYERTVVTWDKDDAVKQCFICSEPFGTLNRKHHCRLCGRIMCGETGCSHFIPLGEDAEIRVCAECESLLDLDHRKEAIQRSTEFNRELEALYAETEQVKRQINGIMPRFNEQLYRFEAELEHDSRPPDEAKLMSIRHEAIAARDTLMLLFRHFEMLLRKIRGLPLLYGIDEDCLRAQMCQNIHRAGVLYLQDHMIPLQQLPTLDLKRLQQPAPALVEDLVAEEDDPGAPSFLPRFLTALLPSPAQERPRDVPKPANLRALQEKMQVLREQKVQLEGFLADAVRAQKFDDVRAIRANLQEINQEIHMSSQIMRSMDLAAHY